MNAAASWVAALFAMISKQVLHVHAMHRRHNHEPAASGRVSPSITNLNSQKQLQPQKT
jgi:hypothetical protein